MKKNKINNNRVLAASVFGFTLLLLLFSTGCKKQLPGEGDIDDLTPPSALFAYAQNDVSNYLAVSFLNSSVSATDYAWDFGDGATSTEFEPVHEYAAGGTYTVKLVVSDKLNVTSTLEMEIELAPPTVTVTAGFTANSNTANYLEYTFTNSSTSADTYAWDFGDGNISTDVNPVHTYAADGSYTVTLNASNSFGGADTETKVITVSPGSGLVAVITNPSFDDEAVQNDNRTAWRNTALESDGDIEFGPGAYVLQMSTTSRTGANAGKLPTLENNSEPQRWLYQVIAVAPNTNYEISGWIRNKDAGVGSNVTFAIYDAPFDNASNIANTSAILATEDFNAATGHDVNSFTEAKIQFNSGSSNEVVLFITNDFTLNGDPATEESETFLDDFSIIEF